MTDAKLADNPIDGRNVWDLIRGAKGATNPHEYYAFSTRSNFDAVMMGDGRCKMPLTHQYQKLITTGMDGAAGKYEQRPIETSLFDLQADRMERVRTWLRRTPRWRRGCRRIADRRQRLFPVSR